MREIQELRPPCAARLLAIWRENARAEAMERALLCNAQVLAEGCLCRGEAVFASREEVLAEMTTREMETLLRRMASSDGTAGDGENPAFDPERFRALQGG